MKEFIKKVTALLLLLIFICTQFSFNHILLKLHDNSMPYLQEVRICSQEKLMPQIEIQPLEKSEWLVEENMHQQYTESNPLDNAIWNSGALGNQGKNFFLQGSAFFLFADIICNLLRVMIAYRYKQDGKKQKYKLAFTN